MKEEAMDKLCKKYMDLAISEAKYAEQRGDIPIGAVIVKGSLVMAATGNKIEQRLDPTAHAEMLAIQEASRKIGRPRLVDCDLYVTLEPCAMCAQAIVFARLRRLYFGAYDSKGGGVDHGAKIFNQRSCNHHPEVYGGMSEKSCSSLLQNFFKNKRG
jgi:tRNA(Arg) A34 adenosine deaminase TadA